ncbi:iron-siderophore ABC transporter substrate-binding protein [Nocardiopsis sp. MT53]|uniref:Iron-siderophore ABC transporter substrate-binding protein n=1 Tax=Nocardiopsis changdeensis TaxID=2831969 RepID=A0ABX8BCY9_9ACTN|nr:iron-siderophore ABC transporter substrate-binding protein [Nocardiopsis changdeensis]QYX36048.1 iron-siderophore ABC transporter substrate-binding protein [Nocardiopsis sp. MT53]
MYFSRSLRPGRRTPPARPSGTTVTLAASALVLVLGVTGCSGAGPAPASEGAGTRTVEGANGTVEVPADPQRIAVLWRPTLAAVTLLGHHPVAAMGTPGAPGQGLAPFLPEDVEGDMMNLVTNSPAEDDVNLEALALAGPDLIIGVSTQVGAQDAIEEELSAIAPTVLLEWEGTGSWRTHLHDVAAVLGREAEAERADAAYDAAVEEARDAIGEAGVDPATEVSLVRLQSDTEVRLETAASFPGQVIGDLGLARPEGQAEPEGGTDFVPLSYENLDRGDGDVVFVLAGSGFPDAPDTFSDGVWAGLEAVRGGRVYRFDYDVWGASNLHAAHRIVEEATAALTGRTEPAL